MRRLWKDPGSDRVLALAICRKEMNPVDISNKVKDVLNEVIHSELADPEAEITDSLYVALLERFYQLTYNAIETERERNIKIANHFGCSQVAKWIREKDEPI